MSLFVSRLCRYIGRATCVAAGVALWCGPAHAMGGIVDALNLAPFVPLVLDALMAVATGAYDFFVGRGGGIIYVLIWGFLGLTMGLYLVKMFFPKDWLAFFGFSGGGEMWDGKASGTTIAENMFKPALCAIIAATVLLQIKPVYVTEWVVNPFLQLGAIYTEQISDAVSVPGSAAPRIECPPDVVAQGWISAESCAFLVQPVSDLSHANNQVIKRGFDFVNRGLRGLLSLIPHGGEDFLNLITGILLISTFVGCNLFMALLIIQGIFNFGMALILYPFQVLVWVVKPKDASKWFDIWPVFSGIVKALQQLVITMIACAFILCINIAIIRALFQWNTSVFNVAAGGAAMSNVPQIANSSMGFGQHSILWLSAILTFYLMIQIFERTRAQLKKYASGMDGLYNQVTRDSKTVWRGANDWGKKIGRAAGWIKKK